MTFNILTLCFLCIPLYQNNTYKNIQKIHKSVKINLIVKVSGLKFHSV